MKTAIIISGDVKQIVFMPETESDKAALAMLDENHEISLMLTSGSIYDASSGPKPFSANVSKCQGGYLRLYKDKESKVLVLTPKC